MDCFIAALNKKQWFGLTESGHAACEYAISVSDTFFIHFRANEIQLFAHECLLNQQNIEYFNFVYVMSLRTRENEIDGYELFMSMHRPGKQLALCVSKDISCFVLRHSTLAALIFILIGRAQWPSHVRVSALP